MCLKCKHAQVYSSYGIGISISIGIGALIVEPLDSMAAHPWTAMRS